MLAEVLITFSSFSPMSIRVRAFQQGIASLVEKDVVEVASSFPEFLQSHIRNTGGLRFLAPTTTKFFLFCYIPASEWRSLLALLSFQEYEEPVYSYSTYPGRR